MIAPKKKQEEIVIQQDDIVVEKELVSVNPIAAMFYAVKRTLQAIKTDPEDDSSPPLFQAIKLDQGQFDRIVRGKFNAESGLAFPAVFVHFTNIRFLVQQQRIGEGRANMRIRFVLNRRNPDDEEFECEGFEIAERINIAIQDAKSFEPALNERCNLTFIDQPQTMTKGVQAFWVDYEVWFRDTSAWKYRNWMRKTVVMPPFTNHRDQDPENNHLEHEDHTTPTYQESSTFEQITEEDVIGENYLYDIDNNLVVDASGNKILIP